MAEPPHKAPEALQAVASQGAEAGREPPPLGLRAGERTGEAERREAVLAAVPDDASGTAAALVDGDARCREQAVKGFPGGGAGERLQVRPGGVPCGRGGVVLPLQAAEAGVFRNGGGRERGGGPFG